MRAKIQYRSREADGSPNPTDIVVGHRLRHRRMVLGWSQEQVASSVGLTFQQVQKYERGINRIGASRLYELSLALGVPVNYFFEGAPADAKDKIQGFAEDSAVFSHESTVEKREALELIRLFNAIPSANRSKVMGLVRSIASTVGDIEPEKPARRGRPAGSVGERSGAGPAPAKRGRGRPRKSEVAAAPFPLQPVKRGRGRPRKSEAADAPFPLQPVKRGRGRPRKNG